MGIQDRWALAQRKQDSHNRANTVESIGAAYLDTAQEADGAAASGASDLKGFWSRMSNQIRDGVGQTKDQAVADLDAVEEGADKITSSLMNAMESGLREMIQDLEGTDGPFSPSRVPASVLTVVVGIFLLLVIWACRV